MKKDSTTERTIAHPETRCRALRKKARLSQLGLAVRAEVGVGTIYKLEMAESPKDLGALAVTSIFAVADAFGVAPVRLWPRLGRGPEPERSEQ